MTKEIICKYCRRTQKDIRAESRITKRRVVCFDRQTPKGFHKFIYVERLSNGNK